jgi:Uma2 family endonuclease
MLVRIPMAATKADLRRVSAANPESSVELWPDGELSVTPPTGGASGERNARLAVLIGQWAAAHDYVAFDSSAGFELLNKAVLSPDAAIVQRSLWMSLTAKQREAFVKIVPDVAIEIVSQSDQPAHLRAKLELFRQAGTMYVVLIDPYRREIWTDGTPPPDFALDLASLLE